MKNSIGKSLAGISLVFLLSCTTHIYLVRHAERLNNSQNSPLSSTGFQRANVLRDSLLHKGIDSIFVSTFVRTQQTAQPLCTALDKNFAVYNKDTSVQFAQHLKRKAGKNILVVGHSDNVPQMITVITNSNVTIPDTVFNKMFIITIKKFLTTSIHLKETTYGAP